MMPDIENLIRSTLEDVGNSYEPTDTSAARERFLQRKRGRRFRLVISGVAVTAAAVAAALLVYSVPATEETDEAPLPPAAASAPQPIATIAVGEEPTSISSGPGGVWVAQADSVQRIDPEAGRVTAQGELEAPGDEVVEGEGSVWVTDAEGSVTRFAPVGDDLVLQGRYSVVDREDAHLDIATVPGAFVAADPERGLIYELNIEELDDPPLDGLYGLSEDEDSSIAPTDVVYGLDRLWLLDGAAGNLGAQGSGDRFPVPAGQNADLAVDGTALWVAGGTAGRVVKVDPETGERLIDIVVDGAHTDLAVGGGFIWALTGAPDTASVLRQIDPATGEIVGEPLVLEGRPTDVTFAAGSAWVSDGDGGLVIRIEPGRP